MIMREQVESYRGHLDEIKTAAVGDLRELLDNLESVDKDEARELLFEAMPTVFDPYALAASDVSATFYEESRAAAGSPTPYTPKALAEPVPPDSWKALVGYGTSPDKLGGQGVGESFDALSGGLVKRLTEAASDTAHANAMEDPDPVSFQRVPAPGCCGFCGMLASRGAKYGSREAAGVVVGRGQPVKKTRKADGSRKSGGQAKGVKTRGTRKAGESFHDNCNCAVIAVHQGNAVEMAADADKYLDAFIDARENIDAGLEMKHTTFKTANGVKNRYRWEDAKGKTWSDKERRRAIAQAMNKDANVMDAIAAEAFPNRPHALPDLFKQATPKPSAGPALTYENVVGLSDDELMEAMSSVFAEDPEAWDKLEAIMEKRELAADEAALAKFETSAPLIESEEFVDPFGTVLGGENEDVNPAEWVGRKLTPNEKVAEEFWSYSQNQYQTALEELNGVLFNKEFAEMARAKGVTEDSLFMGPHHIANKYASEELKAWWAINGRETQTSYRYMALGRPSDRKAWLSVQKQGLHATGSSAERRRLGI